MPNRWHITLGACACVIIFDYITITKLKLHNIMLQNQVEGLEHMLLYLGNVLERNEIELDEFDMIALNNPGINSESNDNLS